MFARTKRLTLRPGWPEDAAAVAQAIAHEAVVTRLSRAPWPYTLSDAVAWLLQPGADAVTFLVFDHAPGAEPRLVGSVGLHREEGELELGYWYTPAAWGRGYATEAGRAALDAARYAMGITRIASGFHVDNPASGRVLRKLGFLPTGETREAYSRARRCTVPTTVMRLDLAPMAAAA